MPRFSAHHVLRVTTLICLFASSALAASPAAPVTAPTTRPADGEGRPAPDLRIGNLPVGKVLFLGNSITQHGPAANIGWSGDWGMAATAANKDYVHLLTDRLAEASRGTPQVRVRNIADFERQYDTYDSAAGLKDELEFEANVVVVAIGENVPALTTPAAKARFSAAFAVLLAELKKHGHPALFVRSSFWADATKDEIMRKVCTEAGGIFVDIGALGKNESNFARAERKIEHPGVAVHPGDRGMSAIADALWEAIQKASDAR